MNSVKTENWNNHSIRFVEVGGEWWAVAQDVTSALGLTQTTRAIGSLRDVRICDLTISNLTSSKARHSQSMNIICEKDIYRLVFKSRKREAEAFQDWVFDVLKELRQASGLAGFEVFRMMDKDLQKSAMLRLRDGLKKPVRVDFIKANVVANKAVSNKHGYPKMVKKADMTPQMLIDRQAALDETVELMTMNERYGLGVSVSNVIYARFSA